MVRSLNSLPMTYHEMAEQFREIVEAMEQRLDQPRINPVVATWARHLREDYKSLRLLAEGGANGE